jgi:purine-binding chemotaxis protein CheW
MQYELITFGVAGQRFGIDIMTVREIRAWSQVTPLPRVPDYVTGVVNLRGTVLPVIDLAARLGWGPTDATTRNPIIVIEYEGQLRGLIVHDVADIVPIEAGTIQQPHGVGHENVTGFLEGVTQIGEDMVMVLDMARLADNDPLELAA